MISWWMLLLLELKVLPILVMQEAKKNMITLQDLCVIITIFLPYPIGPMDMATSAFLPALSIASDSTFLEMVYLWVFMKTNQIRIIEFMST